MYVRVEADLALAARIRRPARLARRGVSLLMFGLLILQINAGCSILETMAFPGAEGFGAASIGGRSGRVIEVTNLDDIDPATGQAVPGSLRAAIEASGPRIVVFRVSGTINVCESNKKLVIQNPYITIAGQTAPGGGITLRLDPSCAGSALTIWTNDVVIRHIRFRPGSNPAVDLGSSDAISISGTNAHDIIIDHCSFSWATDENVDISWGARNVTIQYSIISEALKDAPRPLVGPSGGYGMLIAEGDPLGNHTRRISLHHNLFAHNWYRNPQVGTDGPIDFRNNVIYDWGLHGLRVLDSEGPTQINIIGNQSKAGPSTGFPAIEREIWALHSNGRPPLSYFVQDNLGPRRPSSSLPELNVMYCRQHYEDVPNSGVNCDPATFSRETAFAATSVTTSSPATAYEDVLANAGTTRPSRDTVDLRVVAQVRNGTGGQIADPASVGGWPWISSAAAPTDSDHDGMPNAWESQYGLDNNDANDGYLDPDSDRFSNVEEFLNATNPLVPDPSLIAVSP